MPTHDSLILKYISITKVNLNSKVFIHKIIYQNYKRWGLFTRSWLLFEYIPEEVKKFIDNKNITNIFRKQGYDSVMC